MGNIDNLFNDYQLHRKARTQKHASYPARYMVPDESVSWKTGFPAYDPIEFNAAIVLDENTPWADPQDISMITRKLTSYEGDVLITPQGIPLNPFGRTGLSGRGVLGKWGANFAVDGIITTTNPQNQLLQVLTIIRQDTGEMAFPGGMVDPGEEAFETRNRELAEELSLSSNDLANPLYETMVYRGYVDDPRNTDNAWMETTVIHTHLSFEKAKSMKLSAGDDARGFQWTDVTPDCFQRFYANHGYSLWRALKVMEKTYQSDKKHFLH